MLFVITTDTPCSQRCTERQDIPVAGSCVSFSDPHCLWHVPHVIPAWQTQSVFEPTSTASPAEHVVCCYNLLSDEEQTNEELALHSLKIHQNLCEILFLHALSQC